MALGKQIRKYREKMGWTLEELEEKSGVQGGTIHALEQRDSSRSKFAAALARAFELTIEQLIDDSKDWIEEKKQAQSAYLPATIDPDKYRAIAEVEEWNRLPKPVQDAVETFIETAKQPYPVSKIVCLTMVRKLRAAVSLMIQGSNESWDEEVDSEQAPLLAHELESDKVIDALRQDIFREIFPISYEEYRQLDSVSKGWITGAMKRALELEEQPVLERG